MSAPPKNGDVDRDVAGWNAFDAATQAWLRAKMAERALVDVHGEAFSLSARSEPVRAALRRQPMRESQLAAQLGLSREAVAAAVADLIRRGLAARDAENFVALVPLDVRARRR